MHCLGEGRDQLIKERKTTKGPAKVLLLFVLVLPVHFLQSVPAAWSLPQTAAIRKPCTSHSVIVRSPFGAKHHVVMQYIWQLD